MADIQLDAQERHELCDLLYELGPSTPTLLGAWTAHDLAAHIVSRERDLVAGPCIVRPGPNPHIRLQPGDRVNVLVPVTVNGTPAAPTS